jgi:hypothetical protein
MDANTAIGVLTAAAVSGVGLGAGAKLIPTAIRAYRDLQTVPSVKTEQTSRFQRPERKRQTSIVGLYQDLLRHADGSYTRAYELPLQATMLSPDETADALVDGFADMLTVEMPAGTVLDMQLVQIRGGPSRNILEHVIIHARIFPPLASMI